MRGTIVRALVVVGLVGAVVAASCTGDAGPTGPTGPAGPAGATGATGATGANGPVEVEVFKATLTGANEVPATNLGGSGTAVVTLVGGLLSFRIDIANMTNVTLAHIHTAAAGVSGPVRLNFYVAPSPVVPTVTTNTTLASGVGYVNAGGITQDSLIVLLRNGNAYANVHTQANPSGEIRGQFVKQ